ncbi:MAG: GH92 family glycosyl hydrolase [Flavobacteriaceae bacterium]|nr:GH92 family glycosyl hydrolase [Flavobacteriaceae bacterium]
MIRSIFYCLLLFCFACAQRPTDDATNLIQWVDPFIGTGGHGHTFPGATSPFGMVQLSPDTRLDGWDGCSGYHYSDHHIYGFSHTHLSGTGVSDYGDLLIMPTHEVIYHNGADGASGYRAPFRHDREKASPGYYEVFLDQVGVTAKLTATPRAGVHQYQFEGQKDQYFMIDLAHRDVLLEAKIDTISKYELTGHRFSEAWAKDQRLFFYIRLSHPIEFDALDQETGFGQNSEGTKAYVRIDNPDNEPITITVGISAVDIDGAKNNALTEVGDKTFAQIRQETEALWTKQLSKIQVQTSVQSDMVNFYTSLYHTMIAPNLYQDVDGRYRGMDLEVHQTKDHDYYTVFSLWDTYRAAHPLYTLIEPERTNDFIKTMLAKYDEGGILPIWDLSANYTGCMIGYHGVSVIADAYLKGYIDFDAEKALEAMKHSALQNHLGLEAYQAMGFIPVEEESESVSKTLEYAYDDWAIAQMALELGHLDDHQYFSRRAQAYKNVFDPETGFMRGRYRNKWFAPFDPYEVNFNYTEANAWQYSLYVPQDIKGLMSLMGGPQALESHLDQTFTAQSVTSGREQVDITGLIGQYAHGNEPSHHMAYLYNFVQRPDKTQSRVREILTELYQPTPDGISGNEDCGQMSAWYIWSSLGFYPVTPGRPEYIIGSPLFDQAKVQLPDGKITTIIAHNNSPENPYIQSAQVNGQALMTSYLSHQTLVSGAQIEFFMGPDPSQWGASEAAAPITSIATAAIVPAPFISQGSVAFKNETDVALGHVDPNTTIYYTIDDQAEKLYEQPFKLTDDSHLKFYATTRTGQRSPVLTTSFTKIDPDRSITLLSEYANQYNGGGQNALIDGFKGAKDFRTGAWQGFHDQHLEAVIDLGRMMSVNEVTIEFLQDQRSWIFAPTEVTCSGGSTPDKMTIFRKRQILPDPQPEESPRLVPITFDLEADQVRYIRIKANNLGALPQWHLGHSDQGRAWLFADEITIN